MVDPRSATRLAYRTLYVALAALILFMGLLPLTGAMHPWPLPNAVLERMPDWLYPYEWPGPDTLLCLTVVWVLRRPEFVPVAAIAAVFLVDDLLTMRPPGLWAAIVVVGTEALRSRENATRGLHFLAEWMMAGSFIAGMVVAYRIVQTVFMIPQVSLGLSLVQLCATIAIYPLLAYAMQMAFNLRRAATGEVDAFGQRL